MSAAKLWHTDGRTATLVDHPDRDGRLLLREPDGQPFRTDDPHWAFAPACVGCGVRPAEALMRGALGSGLLCGGCAAGDDEPLTSEMIRAHLAGVTR